MALTDTPPIISYDGNGSTVIPYTLPFKFPENSHVKLYVNGVLSSVGLTISGAGNDEGGEARTNAAFPSTDVLTFLREVPYDQPTDLEDGGRTPAEVLEDMDDYQGMQIQQLREQLTRVPIVLPGQTAPGLPGDADLSALFAILWNQVQTLTQSQQDQAARNMRGWHHAGAFGTVFTQNPDDFVLNISDLAPFKRGEIFMIEHAHAFFKDDGSVNQDPDDGLVELYDCECGPGSGIVFKRKTMLLCIQDDERGTFRSFHPIPPLEPFPGRMRVDALPGRPCRYPEPVEPTISSSELPPEFQ